MRKLYNWLLAIGLSSFLVCAGASFYSYSRYQLYEARYRYNQDHPVFHGNTKGHVTVSTELPRAQADHWLRVVEVFIVVDVAVAIGLATVLMMERRERLAGLEQIDG